MDVKFPLSHYESYLSAKNENDQKNEKKAFLSDVRNHVKEIAKRNYINPQAGTVDYVLMFIPNESIYSFLNQEDKELIDFSLSKRILLCSPITLYAILSLIRQAVSNFSLEQRAGDMQNMVSSFKEQWEKFIDKFNYFYKEISVLNYLLGQCYFQFYNASKSNHYNFQHPILLRLLYELSLQFAHV